MKLNHLLALTLAISLGFHLSLFFWANLPRIEENKRAFSAEKKIFLSFRLPSISPAPPPPTPNPSPLQKPRPSEKRPRPPQKAGKAPQKPLSAKALTKPVPKKIAKRVTPKKPQKSLTQTHTSPKSPESPRKVPPVKASPKPPELQKPSTEVPKLPGTFSKEKTHLTNDCSTRVRGTTSPSTGPSRTEIKRSYLAMVLSRIEKKRYYPRLARMRNYEGRVGLLLEISAEGKLFSVKLVKSSGYRVLDRAALKIARMAAPFPPPPSELDPPIKLKIFLKFHLKK